METGNQYKEDCAKLAGLVEHFTGIPKERTFFFVMQNAADELLPCANSVCETDLQRQKLTAVFEFKNIYEKVKQGEIAKNYTLDSADAAMEYFCNYFADTKDREYFVAAYLSNTHEVITTKTISAGSINSSAVYPREILKEALFCNASGVIVSHNHPSGSLKPSSLDLDVTKELKKSFEATGVQMLDHILVAGDRAVSLNSTGNISHRQDIQKNMKAASPVREKGNTYKPEARQPSIREKIAAGRKQLEQQRTAAPTRASAKLKNNALEV